MSFNVSYHDDPVYDETPERRRLSKPKLFAGLLVIAGFLIQSTFAANISLTNGGSTEFGQGIQQTVFCGGNATTLTVTPSNIFVNSSGAGANYIQGVDVSGIPAQCAGVDFTIEAFDSVTSTSLPLISAGVPDLVVYDNAGTFQPAVAGVKVISGSGSFSATFMTQQTISNAIYRITAQTSKHAPACWTGDSLVTCPPIGGISYGNTAGTNNGYLTMSNGFAAGDTFTVEAWVKAPNTSLDSAFVVIGAGQAGSSYALTLRNVNATQWSIDMAGFARMNFDLPSGSMANDTWHYVVAVKDSDGISMFLNGTKLNFVSATCGANCTTTANGSNFNHAFQGSSMQIGAWSQNGWFSHGQVMNYLRLSNVALFSSKASSVPMPTAVPTSSASTKLLIRQASITPVTDYSSLSQTLTITGNVVTAN